MPASRVVCEERQGLVYARLAGIRATTGAAIVMFDDDNEPGAEYTRVIARCLRAYPFVGVWGPGTIDVDVLDPVPPAHLPRIRSAHNQRNEAARAVRPRSCHLAAYYPVGMGIVVRRDVADSYAAAVDRGKLEPVDGRARTSRAVRTTRLSGEPSTWGLPPVCTRSFDCAT